MNRFEKLEQWIPSIVFYVVPIIVFIIITAEYILNLWISNFHKQFAWRGMNLLIFLLFIKPLYVISKKYFEPKKWNISDFFSYILKWWTQAPILIFIKELVVNLVFSLSGFFLKYRRLLGILTFWCIFIHLSLLLISRNSLWIGLFSNIWETFIWMGYVGIGALFIGFITSNNFSMKLLWRYRKTIQQIAYIALFAGSLHSTLQEWERWWSVALILIYIVLKIFEWKNISFKKAENKIDTSTLNNTWKTFEQWKCNPCGYIYDEQLWDPEWWIAPGTKREDIPNNWKCPICWVWKDQFTIIIRSDSNKKKYITWKIINRKMLSDNVVELWVEVFQDLEVLPWQWIWFVFDDEKWQFIRAYSVAYSENENNVTDCVFLIKILEEWRAGKKFKALKIWDEVRINWVFGHFVLKENDNEKFFIATWTWFAPIINMIKNDKSTKRTLLFGAQYKKDVLREDEIKKIPNLNYKIFLSREKVEWYEYGRIDLNKFELNNDMEFYICGAPPVVKSMLDYLRWKWFDKIHYEEFF